MAPVEDRDDFKENLIFLSQLPLKIEKPQRRYQGQR
jgi:hypothetical protein